MKHTVVLTAEIPDVAVRLLSQECEVVVHPGEADRPEEDLVDILSEADGAITILSDPLTRRVLQSNPNLRIVAQFAVGVNNIDLEAARELDIVVTNTPGVLTDATADLAMALMLAVTRRIVEGDALVRRGDFHGTMPTGFLGRSLQRKQLGIIGMGRIGLAVARRASAFGMSIAYNARSQHADADRLGCRRLSLHELVESSDVISLHCPLTDETRHIVSAAVIARMKPGSFLINTGRGPLVDEAALAAALQAGHLGGAGLDVYENEPEVHPELLIAPNTVLLPHIGSATEETRSEMARMAAEGIITFFRGGRPAHVVG